MIKVKNKLEITKWKNKSRRRIVPLHQPTLRVRITSANIFMNLTDRTGSTKTVISGGSAKLRNAGKENTKTIFKGSDCSSWVAAATLSYLIANRINELGIKKLKVIFKGINKARKHEVLKALENKKINVSEIKDLAPLPFNGCRRKKKRRL